MVILGSLFFLALSPYAYASPFNYSFTNNGTFDYIDPLAGGESAADYYDYYNWDGHPDFGTQADTAFIWLWEDTIDETISLGLIFSDPKKGHKGKVDLSLGGFPDSAGWVVKDDPNDKYTKNASGWDVKWKWVNKHTDGGVIGGLENAEWDLTLDLGSSSGIDNWYMLDGADKGNAHLLDMSEGLTIHSESAAAVPEPSTILLLTMGAAGLFGSGIRRIKARFLRS